MASYFPLGLSSKVKHEFYPFVIPSKNFSKYKREFNPKTEVGNIFAQMYQFLKNHTADSYHTLLKKPETPDIIKVLNMVIPYNYFGCQMNRRKFFFIIKRILTQTRGEFIHICILYEGYNLDDIPWLNRNKDAKCSTKDQLLWANLLLLQTVVKPLIRYFYYFLNKYRNREFLVVPRGQMHSFTDSNINKYLKMGYIDKVKKYYSRQVLVNGALRFIPKKTLSSLDARPLVLNYLKDKWPLDQLRKNLKLLIQKYKIGPETCLYKKWTMLVGYIKNRRKLHAIKLDLIDAFGMVDLKVLKAIIKEDDQFLTEPQKMFLYKIISHQYVHIQGTQQIYKWCHGLLQGTNLSPTLCELYLTYLVFKYLSHFKKPHTLIHRTVDDILFVSTCDSDVHDFELAAARVFLLNEDKNEKFLNIGENPSIIYCGKVFNFITREICNSYAFEKDTEMRVKFKFWNKKHQFTADQSYEFIEYSMKFAYVNFCFSRYELNTTCNSTERVLKNIFDGMCFVAFKMDAAVESISYVFQNLKKRSETVTRCIIYVIMTYSPIIMGIIEKYKGEKHENIITYRLVKILIRRAFIVVFQKRYAKYKDVINQLKAETRHHLKVSDVNYFFKLPKHFENIKMRRQQKCI